MNNLPVDTDKDLEPSKELQTTVMEESAKAEATQRVQAALVIAKKFPRNITESIRKIRESCKRIGLAEKALFSYPRAGQNITGPSIRLAECLAQCWGNLDWGTRELETKHGIDGYSVVEAYCWDLETNVQKKIVFNVPHKLMLRNGTFKHLTDPRDCYEMVANQGARRVRSCVLNSIPGDIVDLAIEESEKTLQKGSGEPLIDRVNKAVCAFADIGVDQAMLEKHLKHEIKLTTEQEMIQLKKIFTSLKEGHTERKDWFEFKVSAQEEKGTPRADIINEKFKSNGKKSTEEQAADEMERKEKGK